MFRPNRQHDPNARSLGAMLRHYYDVVASLGIPEFDEAWEGPTAAPAPDRITADHPHRAPLRGRVRMRAGAVPPATQCCITPTRSARGSASLAVTR